MDGRTTILPCPHCRRRLRVPTHRGELILTCPRCRTGWDWSPPAGGRPRVGRDWGRWVLRVLRRSPAGRDGQEQQAESEPIRIIRPVVVPDQFFVCGPIAAGLLALLPGFFTFVISNRSTMGLPPVFGPGFVAFGLAFAIILGRIALKVFYEPGLTSYAIYPDRIESVEGLLNHQRRTVLLDKIIEVCLIEGVLQRTVGAGSISVVSQRAVGEGEGRVWNRTFRLNNVADPGGVYELIRSLALGGQGAESTPPE